MNKADPHRRTSEHKTTGPWFVVQLKPNCEAIAKRNLRRQGVEIFAPFDETTVRRGKGLKQVCTSLFPGYLFVSVDTRKVGWRTINSTLGVCRLVSFANDQPSRMPPELIDGLMQRCDSSGKLMPPKIFRLGNAVRVARGPFADFAGTVERLMPDQRIWVLLEILGKQSRVEMRRGDLRLTS